MLEKNELEKLYYQLRNETLNKWNRVLPAADLIVDRWEKAAFLNFGENSSIYDSSIVMGSVKVGKNTWIGPDTLLDGTGGLLQIGDGCDISAGVQIYTHNSIYRCLSEGKMPLETGNVSIGDFSYIAPMSIISSGVTIGTHCLVAAHSLVKHNFESYSIIAGIPAKQIGKVELKNNTVKLNYYKGAEK